MKDYSALKREIQQYIRTNNNQEITGEVLQNVLVSIVSNVGENAGFGGIAKKTTSPGTPDGPVFYFATEQGVYPNFGGLEIEKENTLNIIYNTEDGWDALYLGNLVPNEEVEDFRTFKHLENMNFEQASEYCATFDNIIEKIGGGAIRFSRPVIFTFSYGGTDQGMIINSPSSNRVITQYAFTKGNINSGFSHRLIQYNPTSLTITNVGEWMPISSLIPAATTSAAGLMSADDKAALDAAKAAASEALTTAQDAKQTALDGLTKNSELEEAINGQSPKLFIHAGQRYKTDGTIEVYSDGATTDVLPLSIFGNYQENGIKVTQGQFRMYSSGDYCLAVFFDESKSFVGYVQTDKTISYVTSFPASQIPIDAVYVAFSARTDVSSDDVYNVEFAINGNGLAKDVEKIKEDVVSTNSKLDTIQESFRQLNESLGDVPELVHNTIEVVKGRNEFNKATPKEAGFITSSGELTTTGSYSTYVTSDYYPLRAGIYTIYTTETAAVQRIPVCIFNANKEKIGYVYSGLVLSETFTLENDGYIRFSCGGNAYYNKIMVVCGTTIYPYEEYLVVNKIKDDVIVPQVKEGNVLYKKKYIACGDSYTAWSDATYLEGEYAGKTVNYAREILQRNHMSSDFSIDFAESGSTIALSKEGTSSVDAKAFGNTKYLNIPSDTDYLTIAFGINDTALCNLGQLGDTDAATFYGAWDMVLNYYATNHPSMKIGIIIFQRSNNDFYAAVKEIAKYHGIPYLDFYGGEDTPIYVDGKAYPVDATIKATRHDYFCGHNAGADPNETFQDVKVVVNAAGSNPTHPGHRAHIDEAKIIEAFLRRL